MQKNAAMPDFSDDQREALDRIDDFLRERSPERQWFQLDGAAGTGKSYLLAHLARKRPSAPLCAFTGKAASVISRRTGLTASTVHSAIYAFEGEDDDGELRFSEKLDEGEWRGKVAFLDEHGTVSRELARDLLNTGARIVAVGDPWQLPPVRGERFFTQPDFTLTKVHRQAWDSPIIRQAHSVKDFGTYAADGDDFRVQRHVSRDDILAADVVLCWRNSTRRSLNRLLRAHHGYPDGTPAQPGESVMCLRNDRRLGVLNGAVYELLEEHRKGDETICVVNERGERVWCPGWIEDLDDAPWQQEPIPFAFSNCATVHKWQGSEADSVILVDEYDRAEDRNRWLYTGITRAAKRMLVQRNW